MCGVCGVVCSLSVAFHYLVLVSYLRRFTIIYLTSCASLDLVIIRVHHIIESSLSLQFVRHMSPFFYHYHYTFVTIASPAHSSHARLFIFTTHHHCVIFTASFTLTCHHIICNTIITIVIISLSSTPQPS